MMLAGVRIKIRIGRASATLNAVRNTVITPPIRMPAAKLRRTPSSSPAPNRCAVTMESPAVNPCVKPRIKNMMLLVQPTAASASTPIVRPTISVSAML